MTADDLMRLIGRYTEACDDLGAGLFEQTAAETDAKHGKATFLHGKILTEVHRLHAEVAELDALRDKLAGILSRTAVALRGPEPPLTRWSWHDLPERAAAAIAAIDLMQRTAQHLSAGRAHDSDCAMHNAPAYPAGECDCGALGPNVGANLRAEGPSS